MRKLLLAPLLLAATPAFAQVETLDQIEPGAGEIQVELFTGPGGSVVEVLAGVTDRIVLGAEAELEDGKLEELGLVGLLRLLDPEERPVGVGIGASASIDRHGKWSGAEGRLIIERRNASWWLQGDAIVRHKREDGHGGTGLAYAASAQRRVLGAWFGIEASGRLARISGDEELAPAGEHYAGPSLTFDREIGEHKEVEIGLAWLERLKGHGSNAGPRAFAQFSF
jgi:hypothetical protein